MLINIPDEQAEVLRALKQEMLTQDHDCQAAPRYWIVMETKNEYNVVEDDADATFIKDVDGNIVVAAPGELPSLLELIESRREDILDKSGYTAMTATLKDDAVYISLTDEEGDVEEEKVADCDDAAEFLNNQLSPDPWRNEYSVGWVRFDRVPVKGPLFLTKKAAEEHIAKYGYNYNDPRPYALTAFRSPEIEFLWDLIENTEWSSACETAKDTDGNISPAEPPMLAVEYLREKNRMKGQLLRICNGLISCSANCRECRFSALHRVPNAEQEENDPEQAVAAVQRWALEHPTYENRE